MTDIFDTHGHYDDIRFDDDRDELLERLNREEGITHILNAATNVGSLEKSLLMAKKFDFVYVAAGIHPHESESCREEDLDHIDRAISRERKIVAVGEIGLDYYYEFSKREIQKNIFEKQMHMALRHRLPVVIHNRESTKDLLDIVSREEFKDVTGVFHCFSGSRETARIVLDMGYYISFAGPITFKNARRTLEVLEYVPADRILAETDCPYLTPVPFRGKRNHSGYLPYILEKIGQVKNMTTEDAAKITLSNGIKLFLNPC